MAQINDPRAARAADESSRDEPGQSNELRHPRNVNGRDQHASSRDVEESGLRERADHLIARNPEISVLTGFGLGLGFGLVVTLLLTRREETWYERHVPDSLRQWPDQLKKVPEQVTSRVSRAWNSW
jgi:hypothetical protein